MAKVTGPLMSLDASGTIAKTTTFSKWKGRNYVRHRVVPRNPRSADQAQDRTYLGSIGYGLSFVLTVVKDTVNHVGSAFYQAAVTAAPSGQSWISNAMAKIAGTSFNGIMAAVTAFTALDSTHKGYWNTNAASDGMSDFNLSYGSQAAIASGNILFALASFAEVYLGYTGFATGVSAADNAEVAAFVTYINDSTM